MSDTEDEPFDREAEKEKLRQQLAEEEADRASTQHMSELLLKGATMTNRHCDECGDPLFRHEGREFCPTCGRQRAAGTGEAEGAASAADAGASTDAGPAATTSDASTGDGGGSSAPSGASAAPSPQPPAGGQAGAGGPQPAPSQTAGEADLPAARAALARKVTALAREAEATGDVGRARDLLAAVREGAEALRALEGTGR